MTLKTLDNALELLKYFNQKNPSWGVRELAKEMNMSHSIVYRILATFEKHGFLLQNPDTKKYELGIRFWEYGQMIQDKLQISEMIYPVMKRLSEETGESIFLNLLVGIEVICVKIAESSQSIKYAVSVGSRTPLYAGASNKIIMAYLSEEKQMAIIQNGLKPVTGKTVVDQENLLKDLAEIRKNGWCFTVGEYADSVFGLACPLFNRKGEIVASLTIAGPEYRMPNSKVPETLKMLLKATAEVQSFFDKLTFNFSENKNF